MNESTMFWPELISIVALAAFILVFSDRRKRMGLKTLFLLMTLAAVALGGVGVIIQGCRDEIRQQNLLNPTR